MERYLQIVHLLRAYFKEDTERIFLSGGCFFFAELLQQQIHHTVIVLNREREHCAAEISCYGVYDITGKIKGSNYHLVTSREMAFMKKNYIPEFNKELVLQYVYAGLKKGE